MGLGGFEKIKSKWYGSSSINLECHITEFIKNSITFLSFFFLEIKNRIPVCDAVRSQIKAINKQSFHKHQDDEKDNPLCLLIGSVFGSYLNTSEKLHFLYPKFM